MYGSTSWSWCRSTLAYAVFASKCDASIIVSRLHGAIELGVTFCQFFPSSGVRWIIPSSVPTQTSDGAKSWAQISPDLTRIEIEIPPTLDTTAAAATDRNGKRG